jgi:hypothetical protein
MAMLGFDLIIGSIGGFVLVMLGIEVGYASMRVEVSCSWCCTRGANN